MMDLAAQNGIKVVIAELITAAPEWACGIYVGSLPPYLPGQKEAVPRCWKTR